jgi:tetratricopeptide (TPR) repeat protein
MLRIGFHQALNNNIGLYQRKAPISGWNHLLTTNSSWNGILISRALTSAIGYNFGHEKQNTETVTPKKKSPPIEWRIRQHLLAGNEEAALKVFYYANTEIPLNIPKYNLFFTHWWKTKNLQKLEELFEDMNKKFKLPNAYYLKLLQICLEKDEVEKAESYYQKLKDANLLNTVPYNSFSSYYKSKGNIHKSREWLEKIFEDGVKDDLVWRTEYLIIV